MPSWSVSQFPVHTMGSEMYFQNIQQRSAFVIQAPPAVLARTPTPHPPRSPGRAHSLAALLIKNLPILRRLSTRLALRYSPLEEAQARAHARPHLVGPVGEVHGDAEGQGVVEGVPQQDGHHLHARRPGLPLPRLQGPLHGPLAVGGILASLTSKKTGEEEGSTTESTPPCHLGSRPRPGQDHVSHRGRL